MLNEREASGVKLGLVWCVKTSEKLEAREGFYVETGEGRVTVVKTGEYEGIDDFCDGLELFYFGSDA